MQSISKVSRLLGVSTRTLRYYEEVGLLQSERRDGYAYRVYDERMIVRLKQIVLLRRLRIPLRRIQDILQNESMAAAVAVFQEKLDELDAELAALSTLRTVIREFMTRIEVLGGFSAASLNDEALALFSDSLVNLRQSEETTMEDVRKAEKTLSKLTNVRIVYLPPATVAASHYIGPEPERNAGMLLEQFVRSSGLVNIKPDVRHYGFNHPDPCSSRADYGYEMWVTIPDDMDVPAPLIKKRFPGGTYAAHAIKMGDFEQWQWLIEWAKDSERYEIAWGDPECMSGLLEECLNYVDHLLPEPGRDQDIQLDLLLPIRLKTK